MALTGKKQHFEKNGHYYERQSQIGHSEKGHNEINYYPKNYGFVIMRNCNKIIFLNENIFQKSEVFYTDMKYLRGVYACLLL